MLERISLYGTTEESRKRNRIVILWQAHVKTAPPNHYKIEGIFLHIKSITDITIACVESYPKEKMQEVEKYYKGRFLSTETLESYANI